MRRPTWICDVPRTCGGEPRPIDGYLHAAVMFPAPAGVSPLSCCAPRATADVPRTCGGEPDDYEGALGGHVCSPHLRG